MAQKISQFRKKWTGYWMIIIAVLIVLGFVLTAIEGLADYYTTIWGTIVSLGAFSFWGINYWNNNLDEEGREEQKHKNPYKWVFFGSVNVISILLLVVGFVGAFLIYSDPEGNLFEAIGLVISIIWATIFLRYFVWAIYYYNINYGWTDKDWARVFEARERRNRGELVSDEELESPPHNPYRSQTFGLPTGTVRGMIAFTLLFGAISMLVASMGADGEIDGNSFFWDHFEFFKTAFLMMIAFYFGDRSLKYLQKRWNTTRQSSDGGKSPAEGGESQTVNDLEEDDEIFQKESGGSEGSGYPASRPNISLAALKRSISSSETIQNPTGLKPIIDAGHGGFVKGKYTTGEKKKYTFEGVEGFEKDNNTIYEGVINRAIGSALIKLLDENNIPNENLTVKTNEDVSLKDRVARANQLYEKDRNYYFLSIHSNSASTEIKGNGSKARGFEIYTSVGQTKSDELADIAAKWYKKEFPDFPFRQNRDDGDADKEAGFYVLKRTACPAFLVENLFFDNPNEAKFLLSEAGQMRIATCLFNIVKEIYYNQNNGIHA